MNGFIFTLFCIILLNSCVFSDVPYPCMFAKGKPPGQYIYDDGKVQAENPPIAVHTTADPQRCKYLCSMDKECWYIEIHRQESKCYFYDKNTLRVRGSYMVFWWIPCPIPSSCKPQQYRCKGFWLLRSNTYAIGPRVIKKLTNTQDGSPCLRECLSSPICQSINFRNISSDGSLDGRYCQLLAFSYNRSYIENATSALYEWHCCAHNDDDLPEVCKDQRGKCRGMWKPKRGSTLKIKGSIEQVTTMSKHDCMSMCDANPHCHSVYFTQTNATCILRGNNPNFLSDCIYFDTKEDSRDNWYVYEWTCCPGRQDIVNPYDSDSEPVDARCVCLNATSVGPSIIATDGCTTPVTEHNVTIRSPLTAFWLREEREATVNGRPWTRIFNGEVYLWVARALKQMKDCPKHHCDLYSTIIDDHAECPRIISREEWYARPPKFVIPFKARPQQIIIHESQCPELGCHSQLSCSHYMRYIQYYHQERLKKSDIKFNFVVGQDGRVYEGRGPNVTGERTSRYYNLGSENVALFGWYLSRTPRVAGLRAIRLHLRCMASRSQVIKNYHVFGLKDLSPTSLIPSRYLFETLPNWHHYYRTLLPPGVLNCEAIFEAERREFIIIVSSGVLGGLILMVLFALYGVVWRHALWCPARRFGKGIWHQNPTTLCSVGQRNAFRRRLDDWPAKSTFKRPATLQIHPLMTQLFVLMDTSCSSEACPCLTFIHLLWARCVTHSIFEFPVLLSSALAIQHCHSYRVLLWRDSLYLVHARRRKTARKVLLSLQTGACLCQSGTVEVHPITTPHLDSLQEFKCDRSPFDARYIRENERNRINLQNYCYMLERIGDNEREVTFQEFIHCQELRAAVDMADDREDSEVSSSDSEAELIPRG